MLRFFLLGEKELSISLAAIKKAAKRIENYAYRTPCYPSFFERKLFLKLECFQPVRSFKIRGASNKILSLPKKVREEKGLITASSGNHGLAVAYVASRLGVKATIVLPENAVPEKVALIRALGARLVFAGTQQDERAAKAKQLQQKEGQVFIQPFNDPAIIEGQGTCGLELCKERIPKLHKVFVPIGGGGLISGIALAFKLQKKMAGVKIVGVQPEGSPSMYQSWKRRELTSIPRSATIADGLSVRKPGELTFSLVQRYVDEIVLVSEEELLGATAQLIKGEHLLVEPSGAAAFAAARKNKQGGPAVAVVSGGNISSKVLSQLVSSF